MVGERAAGEIGGGGACEGAGVVFMLGNVGQVVVVVLCLDHGSLSSFECAMMNSAHHGISLVTYHDVARASR